MSLLTPGWAALAVLLTLSHSTLALAEKRMISQGQAEFCATSAKAYSSAKPEALLEAPADVQASLAGQAMKTFTGWLQTAGEFYFGGTAEERANCLSAIGAFELEVRRDLIAHKLTDPVTRVCYANCMVGSLWDYQHSFGTKYLGACRAVLRREGTCTEYSRVLEGLLSNLGFASARTAANITHVFVTVDAGDVKLAADPTGGAGGCGMSLYRR